jgi:hypothetical protein
MRGKRGGWVSVVVGALAVVVVSAAAAAKPQTISVLEVDTTFAGTGGYNAASNGPPSAGQGVTFSATVYKWAGAKRGKPLGHLQVLCTVTSGSSGLCNGAMSLPSGLIELLGPVNLNGNSPTDIAVVGGTGAYVGAQGYMHTKPIGGQNSSTSADVIHII